MKGRPFFMSVPGATIHGQSITKLRPILLAKFSGVVMVEKTEDYAE